MNTLLAPQPASGLPDTLRLEGRTPRPAPLDRLALHLGLRLLLWSTRTPALARDREAHARVYRTLTDRERRERAHARTVHLSPRH